MNNSNQTLAIQLDIFCIYHRGTVALKEKKKVNIRWIERTNIPIHKLHDAKFNFISTNGILA